MHWLGRQHRATEVGTVYVAPGNAGTGIEPALENLCRSGLAILPPWQILLQANEVGLTIVGPEQPLVDGVVDYFQAARATHIWPLEECGSARGLQSL